MVVVEELYSGKYSAIDPSLNLFPDYETISSYLKPRIEC